MRALQFAIVVSLATLALSPAGAEPPPAPNDRFELKQTDGGFLRLDRQTGATAFCKSSGDGYACQPATETSQADASEIEKLEKRIASLEAKATAPTVAPAAPGLPPVPPLPSDEPKAKRSGPKDDALNLPNDKQMDEVMAFLHRAIKRLKGIARDFNDDVDPTNPGPSDRQRL